MAAAANAPQVLVRAVHRGADVSPRKARLVVDMVRGKRVQEAIDILRFTPQKSARLVSKVLHSAIANAENNKGLDVEELYVSQAHVDEATTFKRIRPRARGRADRVFKRRCHITLALGER